MTRALFLAVLLSLAAVAGAQAPDRATEELRAEMVFWESVRGSTDPADFRAYLEQYPNGKFAALARNRLSVLTPKPAVPEPAAAPTAARAPGPVSMGDIWTYRVARGGMPRTTQDVKVTAVAPDGIVEEIFGEGPVQRAEHRKGSYLTPVGSLTLFSPYLLALNPTTPPGVRLSVDNFDSRICNAGWSCSLSARVIGRERVQVPAGTFDATRVEISQSWSSPSHPYDRGEMVSRSMTIWYAPEVKRAVKFTSRGTQSRFVDTQFDLELVSYKLQ